LHPQALPELTFVYDVGAPPGGGGPEADAGDEEADADARHLEKLMRELGMEPSPPQPPRVPGGART
jgi:hypothetical protein